MRTIFTMAKCGLGQAYGVAGHSSQSVEQDSEAHSISGQYDLLMKCELGDGADFGHFVSDEIPAISGIKDTCTLIAFKAFA